MLQWKSPGLAIFTAVCLLAGTAGSAQAQTAIEWSGGGVINLGPGAALGINDAGQVVGISVVGGNLATEWSGGSVISLGGLPGFTESFANSINNAGQVVG